MNAILISPDEVARDWDAITEQLWPAIRQDPSYNVQSLYHRLINGTALLFRVSDGANGYWVVSLDSEVNQNGVDELIAWTTVIAGQIDGGPKRRLSVLREAIAVIENVARIAGCSAHRICGRDYSRVFQHYAPYSGAKNGLEVRL